MSGCGSTSETACASMEYLLQQYWLLQPPLVVNNGTNSSSSGDSASTETVAEKEIHIITNQDIKVESSSMVKYRFYR